MLLVAPTVPDSAELGYREVRLSATGHASTATGLHDASIVVVNWGCADEICAMAAGLNPDWLSEVIVVDNGSPEWPTERVRLAALASVTVLRRSANGGYAAGVNVGMSEARKREKRFAVLVNPDARPHSDAILQLLDLARSGNHAVVGTAQRGPSGRYVTAAVGRNVFARDFTCPGCEVGSHSVDIASGAVLVVDLEVAESLGGFDESFFHYEEEVDYCLRVRGLHATVAWSCRTEILHSVGASMPHNSARAHYYTARNKILLVRKHSNRWRFEPRLAKDELKFAVAACRDEAASAWLRGLIDGLRNVSGAWTS